ncbi:NHL domain-containing protein [Parachitinimonas caeni]|uniref:SMP-30/gluconolactonase/LRE family protein n=1 Tax=Parachitinimonas caeni TaxID=3031301 RepID=A0ABT7DRG0_9NEIS|nr:SMP-30/gluconolactonase/LRE family protein [Parachitinimonas caeni]MDK2122644.1 SMP-30/gluconolactonase/LRE family protein [Parachitinimonas caeni]
MAILTGLLIGGAGILPAGGTVPALAGTVGQRPSTPQILQPVLLAGEGIRGWRDGAAGQARFADPYGIAADSAGNLYVADAGDTNRIRRLGADGQVSTLAGGREGFADGKGTAAAFHTPSGLALDATGNLYVADTGNHAIRKISPAGLVTTLAGTGQSGFRDGPARQAQFNGPMAIAVDKQGRVYVADTYNDRIRRIDLDGMVTTLAGGNHPGFADGPGTSARFDTPCGLAVDAQGNVWIADTRNRAIRKLASDGRVSTLAQADKEDEQAPLRRPLAITAGTDGHLYVGEMSHGRLLRFSPQGDLSILIGATAERINRPAGIALGPQGKLYFSDAQSYRVYQASPNPPALSIVRLGPAPTNPLPATQQRWPLAPQNSWHEVVGTLGEVRGKDKGDSRDHLHNGLDIRADVGEKVLAIAGGKVSDPLANWGYDKQGEGMVIDTLGYIHMKVGRDAKGKNLDPARFQPVQDDAGKPRIRIRRGTRFQAGEALGSVNSMAHVHLTLGADNDLRNPLQLGFKGYADKVPPRIEQIALLTPQGKPVGQLNQGTLHLPAKSGALQLVVEASDQVDGNQPQRRLGLYALGYQLLRADGSALPGFELPRMSIEFSHLPADPDAVKFIYAEQSGITVHGSATTRFRYNAHHTLRNGRTEAGSLVLDQLPAGEYLLRIVVKDFAGNEGVRLQRVRLG